MTGFVCSDADEVDAVGASVGDEVTISGVADMNGDVRVGFISLCIVETRPIESPYGSRFYRRVKKYVHILRKYRHRP